MSDAVLTRPAADVAATLAPARRAVRAWHVYLAVGVAAIAAYYRLPKASWSQAILLTGLNLTVAVVAARAAYRSRGWNLVAWVSLAMAMLLSAVGNGPYFGYVLVTEKTLPFPSAVDIPLLAAYPFFALALVALIRVHRSERGRISLGVAAVLATGASYALWQAIVAPALDVTYLAPFAKNVSAAYPALTVALLAVMAWFVVRASGKRAASMWIMASFVVLVVAAVVFSAQMADFTYAYGGVVDGLWMLQYLLIGVAALHPSAAHAPRR